MKKQQIIDAVEAQEVEHLKNFFDSYLLYGKTDEEDIEKSDIEYLENYTSERADSNTIIYNYELLEWLRDNYSIFEDYIDEFGIDSGNFDLMKNIMGAYWYNLQNELTQELQEFINNFEEND